MTLGVLMSRFEVQMLRGAVGLLGLGMVSACASNAAEVERRQLRKTIAQLTARSQQQDARLEELSNRIFVLSDRVDSIRVELTRAAEPPELQVVRLLPDAEPPTVSEAPPERNDADEPPVVIRLNEEGALEALPVADVPLPPTVRAKAHGDAEQLFRKALRAYREGRAEASYQRFSNFLAKYPRHAYADNALYWMGECQYDARQYRRAIQEFVQIIKRYPRSNKVPDALLKMGLAYERIGEVDMAKKAFGDIISGYPRSALADLARAHLAGPTPTGGAQ